MDWLVLGVHMYLDCKHSTLFVQQRKASMSFEVTCTVGDSHHYEVNCVVHSGKSLNGEKLQL